MCTFLFSSFQDTVTRYAHQTGHYVSRRFGWDCHGLPVEQIIDKKLGIKGPDDVTGPDGVGIKKYNAECRSIVTKYTSEWEHVVTRLGRWIDFKNDYKTMEPWFMESVWWVFSQLWNKDLVYRSVKVMPYSTALSTPLSNFEAKSNYQDVVDPAVVVSFPRIGDKDGASFLAWTTTPWTLPSNLALCVHPKMEYVKVKDTKTGNVYIMATSRLVQLYKGKKAKPGKAYNILEKFVGKDLEGSKYTPLFEYFVKTQPNAFRVVVDKYVTDQDGTGIVHQAPAFGEDDLRVCKASGIIKKDEAPPCPIDPEGCFTDEISDFKAQFFKVKGFW